jgi:mannose/fructose/N-acetylgalactosamine-specific phosphotransferase system component IID
LVKEVSGMVKKYVFIRLPSEVYDNAKKIQMKMQKDIQQIVGRPIPLTMTKVFKAILSPEYNMNFIEIRSESLIKLAKEKKR